MRQLICSSVIIVCLASPLSAWWSVEDFPTHKYISEEAVGYLKATYPNQYPDIEKFSSTIIGATYPSGNDAIAHGYDVVNDTSTAEAGRYAGGPFNKWWSKDVLPFYMNLEFAGNKKAYFYIGSMAHLVQDQLVPAHAANIYHGLYKNSWYSYEADPDDLEAYVGEHGLLPYMGEDAYSGKEPSYYYYNAIRKDLSPILNTQESIKTWNYPHAGPVAQWSDLRYWLTNSNYPYVGDVFFGDLSKKGQLIGGWGIYGGPAGVDMYARVSLSDAYVTDDPSEDIARTQLAEAASYTAGMLEAVSKSLPPVVQSPSINGSSGATTINPGQANTLIYTLMDNRTQKVWVTLRLDSVNGPLLVSSSPIEVQLDPNWVPGHLPWEIVYNQSWNGLLADGSQITPNADGSPNTIYAVVEDEDQNKVEEGYLIGFFRVSGAPFVTVATPMSTPYARFSGVSSSTPGVVNLVDTVDWANIAVEANISPVTQLTFKRPDGSVTVFNNPDVSPKLVEHLADGHYEVTALDEAGNRTFVTFDMGTIRMTAAPEESSSTYNGDILSAQFKFHMQDWFPLEHVDLLDGSGTSLRTDTLTTALADITYSFPNLFSTDNFTRDFSSNPASSTYTATLYNKEGHELQTAFSLNGVGSNLLGYGTTTDILNYSGLFSGAMGRTKSEWLNYNVGPNIDIASGPIVSVQTVGVCTESVLTSDNADLSGAVEKTLATRSYYYSVWNFHTNPAPQNCAGDVGSYYTPLCLDGSVGQEYCNGTILCHSDTIMAPASLKRYNMQKSVVSYSDFTGIFKSLCDQEIDGSCVSGHYPQITGGTIAETWGVSYRGLGSRFSGGLNAFRSAGDNVTVKLADWLSLTFEHITKDLAVSASLESIPSIPGVLPLRGVFIGGTEGGYTGNIHVTMKYDAAGITNEQIDFMEALKIKDIGARNFDKRSVTVDRVNHVAAFDTPDLGDFMLEVPSYPEPNAYASANLIGATPELGVLSGEPGATMTLVPTGSPLEQSYYDILSRRQLVPAGNAYVLGPTGKKFLTAAAVKMLYDKSVISAKKLIENSLGLYQISEDGSYISKLGNSVLNTDKGEITAEVSEFHSIFVIAGSTEPAQPAPLSPDVTVPVTNLAFGIPAYEVGSTVMISSASPVFADAFDPKSDGNITAGIATTYYLIDVAPDSCVEEPLFTGPSGTCQNPKYSETFTLSPGTHTLWYRSSDLASNDETIKSKTLYVDGDAPLVTVFAAGQVVNSSGTAYVTEADSVTFTSIDPALSGPASGVGMVVFDVSTTPCTGFSKYPQNPGECREILYTGPFSLPIGTNTIYYSGMDNVGNQAPIQMVHVIVAGAPDTTAPGTTLFINNVEVSTSAVKYTRPGSTITLVAVDPLVGGAARSGVAFSTFTAAMLISGNWETVGSGNYTGPIEIGGEGSYTFHYQSVDNAGNWEAQRSSVIHVDNTPPTTGMEIYGSTTTDELGNLIVLADHSIRIVSTDPVSGGVASGIGDNYFMVDVRPEACGEAPTFTGPAGTCLNPRFTAQFTLDAGTHTVYYAAVDNAGNMAELKSSSFTVAGSYRPSMLHRPVVAANAEFKLGEVYVYPNPAKGGKVPVFHVEVGLADSVKIKVFTVAGQQVHEITLTGAPQAIDGKYAYESAWQGHIASGVYYYTMEAERAGKKLRAKGKFAVVR